MKTILIIISVAGTFVLLTKKKEMSYRQSLLKSLYPVIMFSGKLFRPQNAILSNTQQVKPLQDFYSLKLVLNDGSIMDLNQWRGKKLLIVNTASDCGFTAQLEELEKLNVTYADKLIIIGFPSNDFKNQEKGDDPAIAAFCKKNYGVSFLLAQKSEVKKGSSQHPVFEWLTHAEKNGWCNQQPAWNFNKYLINETGVLTHYFAQTVSPLDPAITDQIK